MLYVYSPLLRRNGGYYEGCVREQLTVNTRIGLTGLMCEVV